MKISRGIGPQKLTGVLRGVGIETLYDFCKLSGVSMCVVKLQDDCHLAGTRGRRRFAVVRVLEDGDVEITDGPFRLLSRANLAYSAEVEPKLAARSA